MLKNICPECRTENEIQYTYCKNCGALLHNETQNSDFYTQNNGQKQYTQDFLIDGVPESDMIDFVGKNANKIVPKFKSLCFKNSKVSWCWPVAILSYFLGPVGASFWFFYRKMYKKGFLFLALGMIAITITSLFSGDFSVSFDSILSDYNNPESIYNFIKDPELIKYFIANSVYNCIKIATLVVTGMLSLNWYKNFAVKKLYSYHSKNIDERYYRIGIRSIGGVSVGMVFLDIGLVFVFTLIGQSVISLI